MSVQHVKTFLRHDNLFKACFLQYKYKFDNVWLVSQSRKIR